MTKENIIEKIQKILNLANNNSSEKEADAAMMKAQELLLKYDLSMGDISTAKEGVTEVDIGKVNRERKIIATAMAKYFRVSFILDRNRRRKIFMGICVGHTSDISVFVNVFNFCWKYYKKSRDEFVVFYLNELADIRKRGDHLIYTNGYWVEREIFKTTKRDIQNNYLQGFVIGLQKKFSENTNKFALQLKITAEHKEKLAKMHLISKQAPISRHENIVAINAGITDGSNFKKDNEQLST